MEITDEFLLKEVIELGQKELENCTHTKKIEYPLDNDVLENLKELLKNLSGEHCGKRYIKEIPYDQSDNIGRLWISLIEKSIKCLRYFDDREPFKKNDNKSPDVYGIEELEEYHRAYIDFEGILYGSDCYYRDHVFHVIRCWLLGIWCLLNENSNINPKGGRLIEQLHIEGEDNIKDTSIPMSELVKVTDELKDEEKKQLESNSRVRLEEVSSKLKSILNIEYEKCILQKTDKEILIQPIAFSNKINIYERLSIWTIIALCHDLGYPLEKSQKILNKTKDMLGAFVSQPKIWSDINFNGIQDNINEYIIKFMSSKMQPKDRDKDGSEYKYYGRIQPKYYLKFTKSLEHFSHGMISAIIIYKILLYFIEADANLNDDHQYSEEDARQFYIRRDILRAIASHTCEDIYQIRLTTYTSLLFLCDELQEWGRKSWKSLYKGSVHNSVQLHIEEFNPEKVKISEDVDMSKCMINDIAYNIDRIMRKQYLLYKTIFRDGQYTSTRNFDVIKEICIDIDSNKYKGIDKIEINYNICSNNKDNFKLNYKRDGNTINTESKDLVKVIEKQLKSYKERYSKDNIEVENNI